MRFHRWMAFPLAGMAAIAVGVVGVVAIESASPSANGSTNYGQVFIDKLAGILHKSSSETQNDLKQAQLQTIDQMVKDGRITQAQASALKDRINAGATPGFGFPFAHADRLGDRSLFRNLRSAELDAVAGVLKMTTADLQAQLRAGKSLSDLEKAQGVADSDVKSAKRAAAKKVLDDAVKAGTITQSQEDAILSRIDQGSTHGFGLRRGPR